MDQQHPRHTVTGSPRSRPAHAVRPGRSAARTLAVAAVAAAVLAAVGLGAASCLNSSGPTPSTPTSASLITVTPSGTGGAGPP